MSLQRNTVEDRVLIALENIILDGYEVNKDSSFEDMGMDSLDKIELLMDLEDEFGIDIPDDTMSYLETFGEIVDYIEKHVK